MKQNEFYIEFKKICNYYNNKIYENEDITSLYFEKVKEYELDELKKIIRNFILENKFMPKVAEFVKSSNELSNKCIGRKYSEEFLESFYDIGGC